ncbi:MFS transporter [Streptomyces regalis]|uniref:Multidrug MFS transporter n=1 Tax=Streptomyces regalis TaxID=68262 RepID=A0A101JQ48_9ACTN|nr:MFS transporter [Streptomyces regalis]KUL30603.1 multidrug MFS transporter [Streptomyces regalis]
MTPGPARPGGPAHEGHPRRWAVLVVLVLSLVSIILDNTVLNVTLRTLTDPEQGLGASHSQVEWVLSAYTLAFAAMLFTWGVLGDRLGRRRVLLLGLALFGLSSLAGAYAGSPEQLIAARACMGVSGAAVLPSTLATIAAVFPMRERPKALGIWAASVGFALGIGPVTGGLLLAHFWWGSVFLVNVPIVAVSLVAVVLLVPETRGTVGKRVDAGGLLLSIAGLVLLVYGIIEAGRTGGVTQPTVWGPGLAGLGLLGVFLWHERRTAEPSLELGFFRLKAFSTAVAAVGFVSFAMMGFLFFSAFYLQSVRGYTPLQAGSCTVALAGANVVCGPLSTVLVRRVGPRNVCAAGMLAVTASLAGVVFVTQHAPLWLILALFAALGAGVACVMPTAAVSIMNAIPREKAGVASAMNNTVRQLGGALGVAVLGSLMGAAYRSGIEDELAVLPPSVRHEAGESLDATLLAATRLGESGLVGPARQAFLDAMHLAAGAAAVAALVGALAVLRWLPSTVTTPKLAAGPVPGREHSDQSKAQGS